MEISGFYLFLFFVIQYASLSAAIYIARKRGRSETGWAVATFIFGALTLVFLWLLPSITHKKEQLQTADASPSGDTEHLKVEAMFSFLSKAAEEFQNDSSENSSVYWHYINAEKSTLGPVSFSALVEKWHTGEISSKTFVWNETMDNWKRIEEIESIASLFTKDQL